MLPLNMLCLACGHEGPEGAKFCSECGASTLTGRLAHLDTLFAPQFPDTFARPYENGLDVTGWLPWAVLSAFVVVMLVATIVIQKRKDVV